MAVGRLSARSVRAIQPAATSQFLWDSELRGFGLKCTPHGRRVFIVQYRLGGRNSPTRRKTLGELGTLTPEQARKEAKRLLGDAASGRDPDAGKRHGFRTVRDLCREYLKAVELGEVRTRRGKPKKASTLVSDRGRI